MNENIIFALDTFTYVAISIALAWVTSQAFKTLLKIAITKKKNPRNIIKQFFSDGDFPSSHTAVSVTGCIVITPIIYEAIYNATSKTEILVCIAAEVCLLLWTAMTIRDALGIRMRVQENAQTMQKFLKESKNYFIVTESLQNFWNELGDNINIKAGHMPHEVIGGLILALIFGIGANSIRTENWVVFIIDIIISIIYFLLSYLFLSKKIDLPKFIAKLWKGRSNKK
jgi:acid phosphatase family membrane protein YuiD